jgi:hypothetical protein
LFDSGADIEWDKILNVTIDGFTSPNDFTYKFEPKEFDLTDPKNSAEVNRLTG